MSRKLVKLVFWSVLLVSTPRLIAAFLAIDHLTLGPFQLPALGASAAATASALLIGGSLLLSESFGRPLSIRFALLFAWFVSRAASVVLTVPHLVAQANPGTHMTDVLHWSYLLEHRGVVFYAVFMVLAVEIVADGCALVLAADQVKSRVEVATVGPIPDFLEESAETDKVATGYYFICRHGCGREFSSTMAERAHSRFCDRKAEQDGR